jgi:hypothetical protein
MSAPKVGAKRDLGPRTVPELRLDRPTNAPRAHLLRLRNINSSKSAACSA